MSFAAHPMCEACWIEREAVVDPETGDAMVRVPVIVTGQNALEQCCFCGGATIIGIYVRHESEPLVYCTHKPPSDD